MSELDLKPFKTIQKLGEYILKECAKFVDAGDDGSVELDKCIVWLSSLQKAIVLDVIARSTQYRSFILNPESDLVYQAMQEYLNEVCLWRYRLQVAIPTLSSMAAPVAKQLAAWTTQSQGPFAFKELDQKLPSDSEYKRTHVMDDLVHWFASGEQKNAIVNEVVKAGAPTFVDEAKIFGGHLETSDLTRDVLKPAMLLIYSKYAAFADLSTQLKRNGDMFSSDKESEDAFCARASEGLGSAVSCSKTIAAVFSNVKVWEYAFGREKNMCGVRATQNLLNDQLVESLCQDACDSVRLAATAHQSAFDFGADEFQIRQNQEEIDQYKVDTTNNVKLFNAASSDTTEIATELTYLTMNKIGLASQDEDAVKTALRAHIGLYNMGSGFARELLISPSMIYTPAELLNNAPVPQFYALCKRTVNSDVLGSTDSSLIQNTYKDIANYAEPLAQSMAKARQAVLHLMAKTAAENAILMHSVAKFCVAHQLKSLPLQWSGAGIAGIPRPEWHAAYIKNVVKPVLKSAEVARLLVIVHEDSRATESVHTSGIPLSDPTNYAAILGDIAVDDPEDEEDQVLMREKVTAMQTQIGSFMDRLLKTQAASLPEKLPTNQMTEKMPTKTKRKKANRPDRLFDQPSFESDVVQPRAGLVKFGSGNREWYSYRKDLVESIAKLEAELKAEYGPTATELTAEELDWWVQGALGRTGRGNTVVPMEWRDEAASSPQHRGWVYTAVVEMYRRMFMVNYDPLENTRFIYDSDNRLGGIFNSSFNFGGSYNLVNSDTIATILKKFKTCYAEFCQNFGGRTRHAWAYLAMYRIYCVVLSRYDPKSDDGDIQRALETVFSYMWTFYVSLEVTPFDGHVPSFHRRILNNIVSAAKTVIWSASGHPITLDPEIACTTWLLNSVCFSWASWAGQKATNGAVGLLTGWAGDNYKHLQRLLATVLDSTSTQSGTPGAPTGGSNSTGPNAPPGGAGNASYGSSSAKPDTTKVLQAYRDIPDELKKMIRTRVEVDLDSSKGYFAGMTLKVTKPPDVEERQYLFTAKKGSGDVAWESLITVVPGVYQNAARIFKLPDGTRYVLKADTKGLTFSDAYVRNDTSLPDGWTTTGKPVLLSSLTSGDIINFVDGKARFSRIKMSPQSSRPVFPDDFKQTVEPDQENAGGPTNPKEEASSQSTEAGGSNTRYVIPMVVVASKVIYGLALANSRIGSIQNRVLKEGPESIAGGKLVWPLIESQITARGVLPLLSNRNMFSMLDGTGAISSTYRRVSTAISHGKSLLWTAPSAALGVAVSISATLTSQAVKRNYITPNIEKMVETHLYGIVIAAEMLQVMVFVALMRPKRATSSEVIIALIAFILQGAVAFGIQSLLPGL